jgi:hypothetical protein
LQVRPDVLLHRTPEERRPDREHQGCCQERVPRVK